MDNFFTNRSSSLAIQTLYLTVGGRGEGGENHFLNPCAFEIMNNEIKVLLCLSLLEMEFKMALYVLESIVRQIS